MTAAEPLLLGAGPSPLPESVRARLCEVPPGPMDPAFTAVMDETQVLLRETFGKCSARWERIASRTKRRSSCEATR